MRIGLDVDGVLADFNSAFVARVVEVTNRDLFPTRPFEITTWNYPEAYGYTAEEVSKTWETIKRDLTFWSSLKPYEGTTDALNYVAALHKADDVYFITARPGLFAKQQTEAWLRAYGAGTNPAVLISSAKGLCARALDLDVYIDDRWENAISVGGSTRSYLFHQPWNREYLHQSFGITRVHSVQEMLHDYARKTRHRDLEAA